jgi:hypothetical protein
MRFITSLIYGLLAVAASALAGCGGDSGKGKDETPHNPLLGNPQPGAGGLRRVADMPKVRNEVRNVALAYIAFFADHGRYPKTEAEFKTYVKRDPNTRRLSEALEQGVYVVVLTANPSSNAVLVYEKTPDQKGIHFVAMGDASVSAMTTQELEKALQNKG